MEFESTETAFIPRSIRPTGTPAHVKNNPIARYSFFCSVYNLPCNVVDNQKYKLPTTSGCRYRLLRLTNSCRKENNPCYGCCLVPWFCLNFGQFILMHGLPETRENLKNALLGSSIILGVNLLPAILLVNTLLLMRSFWGLVQENFERVPRSRVLENMLYIDGEEITNKFVEVTGDVALALRQGQISYDEVQSRLRMDLLGVNAISRGHKVEIMLYTDHFLRYLDGYQEGFDGQLCFLLLLIPLIIANIVYIFIFGIKLLKLD